jgi:exodeoxyribonuclease V alpha subunit
VYTTILEVSPKPHHFKIDTLSHGQQFKVIRYNETKPAMLTEIEKYLGRRLIKGVEPVTAKRIVAHFALETLDIIEQHSDRLI